MVYVGNKRWYDERYRVTFVKMSMSRRCDHVNRRRQGRNNYEAEDKEACGCTC
jgi:hypothetical protein